MIRLYTCSVLSLCNFFPGKVTSTALVRRHSRLRKSQPMIYLEKPPASKTGDPQSKWAKMLLNKMMLNLGFPTNLAEELWSFFDRAALTLELKDGDFDYEIVKEMLITERVLTLGEQRQSLEADGYERI